jgi:hypothetical protein
MKGQSWGIMANYKIPLSNNFFMKAGGGYYKYTFNHIKKYDPLFGSNPVRNINYRGESTTFGYVSDKYWYNTISIAVGFDKLFAFKNKFSIVGGIDCV